MSLAMLSWNARNYPSCVNNAARSDQSTDVVDQHYQTSKTVSELFELL
jgi:hypothetical protein